MITKKKEQKKDKESLTIQFNLMKHHISRIMIPSKTKEQENDKESCKVTIDLDE